MPGPDSSKESLVRRCIASQQLLMVLGIIGMLVVGVGMVAAVGTTLDDWESGSWDSSWSTESYNTIGTTTSNVYEGTYSGTHNQDQGNSGPTYDSGTINPDSVHWAIRAPNVGSDHAYIYTDSSVDVGAGLGYQGGDIVYEEMESNAETVLISNANTSKWHRFAFTQINWSDGSAYALVLDEDGTELANQSVSGLSDDVTSFSIIQDDTAGTAYFDALYINQTQKPEPVDGYVKDGDGDPINNATVTAKQGGSEVANTTTNSNGYYSYDLNNGTYNTSASKSGYITDKKTLNVTASRSQNFTLLSVNESLTLDSRRFMSHSSTIPYEVTFAHDKTASGTLRHRDVTDDDANLTVTSNNTNALTVNNTTNEFESTSDRTVATVVNVTANYTWDGSTYSTTQDVFVGNITLTNFGKLPPWGRFEAVIGSQVDGDALDGENATWLLIMAGALVGGVLRTKTTFMGLTGFSVIIIAGWIMGKTGDAVLLIALLSVGFVALNLAANIDYSV